jgi:hypothetical protein
MQISTFEERNHQCGCDTITDSLPGMLPVVLELDVSGTDITKAAMLDLQSVQHAWL